MKKILGIILWIVIGLIVLVVIVIGVSLGQADSSTDSTLPKVTMGIPTAPGMALPMIAHDKRFFEAHGIDVEIKEFTAGKFALQAFFGGSLDFVISGELPVVLATMQGNKLLVPAQVVRETINATRVVARSTDEGITAKEYFTNKKRKLATSFGGGPEFFTYDFLKNIGVQNDMVELISMKPADMPIALVNGDVDAIAIFDPFAFFAEQQLGNEGITFIEENTVSELYVLNAHESIKESQQILEGILLGLIDAEKFIQNQPDEAKEIVAKYTKLDKAIIDTIWSNFDFRVALTPDLLELWNQEAQWAKDTGKVTEETVIPNFRNIIFSDPLKKVSPFAVEL